MSGFQLRPDQQAAEDAFFASTAHSTAIQASTGYGKTVLSSSIVRRWPGRVLFMVHRRRLVRQKSEKLAYCDTGHGIWLEGSVVNPDARVQVGSIQTLAAALESNRDLPRLGRGDLLIIDECHRRDANKIRDYYFAPRVLGLTATPCTDGGMPLVGYRELITTLQPRQLAEINALVEGTYFSVDLFDGGVISTEKLSEFLLKDGVISRYCDQIASWPAAPTVVFCSDIPHARYVCEQLTKRGVRAVAIDSMMDDDAAESAMASFVSGNADVICNPSMLIEGWDHPQLRRVVMLSATASLIEFMQKYGRGTRTAPGKTSWECWDFAGNIITHLDPFMDRVWSLDPNVMRAALERRRAVGVWRCTQCFQCCDPARVRDGKCPSCGAAAVVSRRVATRAGKMVQWDVDQMAQLAAEKKRHEEEEAREAAELAAARAAKKAAAEADAPRRAANALRLKKLWKWRYSRGMQDRDVFKELKRWEREGGDFDKFMDALWAQPRSGGVAK